MTTIQRRQSRFAPPKSRPLEIAFPAPDAELEQDEEWVVVRTPDGWKKIRLHDYAEVFSVPGLYERWVYKIFQCKSPEKIRELLGAAMKESGDDPGELAVLDLGAGNGYVAEELQTFGAKMFVGIDIHQEAKDAAHRDRPGLYDDYVIGDLTNLPVKERAVLDKHEFNCLTCVAALGFGDIPPEVFAAAYNRVVNDGWIAFTIKTDFLDENDKSGFSTLIRAMIRDGVLDVAAKEEYLHRITAEGEELFYVAFIGRKRTAINDEFLKSITG